MKKLVIFLFSVILTMSCVNIYAQNPYCKWDSKHGAGSITNITSPLIFNEGLGCSFLFVLKNPLGSIIGWYPDDAIVITVDGVDYGFVTLPWGEGSYTEETRVLPAGEVQLLWAGEDYDPFFHCFKIYNSSNELIYESSYPEGQVIPGEIFFTYQNECSECVPLTDFEGAYISEIDQVNLSWTVPESEKLTGFDIYRNDSLINHVAPDITFYSDNTAKLETGDYKYCVIPVYPFLCTFDKECYETYISNVGINTYSYGIRLFPNPANNTVNIKGADIVKVKVFNSIGQTVLTQNNTNTINVSQLSHGIYLFSVETSTENRYIPFDNCDTCIVFVLF
jgi:hypothetical protein